MKITKPTENNGWIDKYIAEVVHNDLMAEMEELKSQTIEFYGSLSNEILLKRYAPGKWSILEVLLHIVDSERVFAYRAMRFSRMDTTQLPGYDENLYAANSNADQRGIKSILREYTAVRESSIELFGEMTVAMLDARGIANNVEMSARSLGFAICGHERHHRKIIAERYL